jgi:hypothetical protein
MITSISLLIHSTFIARRNGESSVDVVMKLGVGAISTSTLLKPPEWHLPNNGVKGVVSNIFVANTPQLILSFLYLAYNGMITTMCLATEWSRFGIERKGLRVSSQRRGSQRSTYFLQLPYRFGLPLIVASATLHWLVSQSIFVVNIDYYDYTYDGTREKNPAEDNVLITCGYSPVAILSAVIVGIVLMGATVLVGRTHLKSGMPIASTCSAAIAAACQPGNQKHNEEAAESEVKWGVMDSGDLAIGHCGFSMHPVEYPDQGKVYA